jgi:hypothetical protein
MVEMSLSDCDPDEPNQCEMLSDEVDNWLPGPDSYDSDCSIACKLGEETSPAIASNSHEKRTFSLVSTSRGTKIPSSVASASPVPAYHMAPPNSSDHCPFDTSIWKKQLGNTNSTPITLCLTAAKDGTVSGDSAGSCDLKKNSQIGSTEVGASLEFQQSVLSSFFKTKKKSGRKPNLHLCHICQSRFPYKKELIRHLVSDHNIHKSKSVLYKRLAQGKSELTRLYGH